MKKGVTRVVNMEAYFAQCEAARQWIKDRIAELERCGYVFDPQVGCWKHIDGSEVWIDGQP
jgi:hypothetical protein